MIGWMDEWWHGTKTKFTSLHHCHLLSTGAARVNKKHRFLVVALKIMLYMAGLTCSGARGKYLQLGHYNMQN